MLIVDKLKETIADDVTRLPPAYIIKAKAQKLKKADLSLSGGSSGKLFLILKKFGFPKNWNFK